MVKFFAINFIVKRRNQQHFFLKKEEKGQTINNALREYMGKRQLSINKNTLRRVIREELQAVH